MAGISRAVPAARRRPGWLVLGLAVATACSGSGAGTSTTTTTTGTAPASASAPASTSAAAPAGSNGAPTGVGGDIVVEGIVTLKNHPDADVGFAARVARFDKAGGVGGRQIKFLGVKDDGLDPTQDLNLLEGMVGKDGVFAVAPVATEAMLAPSATYLTQQGVPAVGLGTSPAFCATGGASAPGLSPLGCLVNPSFAATQALAHLVQAAGVPAAQARVALVGGDSDADKNEVTALTALAKAQGVQVVFHTDTITATGTTDYAPIVTALLAAGPNVVDEVADVGGSVALAAVLQAAGYRGAVVNQVTYEPPSVLASAGITGTLSGVYVDAGLPVDANPANPAVAQIRADLVAIDKPPTVDLDVALGYWSADMLIQLLQAAAARSGQLTPASLTATAAAGWTYRGPTGGPADLTFPAPGWVAADGCSTLLQLTGGAYHEVAPYGCGPVTKVADAGANVADGGGGTGGG
jgi:branched-chain amino acid transport system substrate-binding protein